MLALWSAAAKSRANEGLHFSVVLADYESCSQQWRLHRALPRLPGQMTRVAEPVSTAKFLHKAWKKKSNQEALTLSSLFTTIARALELIVKCT